jgi:hypothetical protein
VLRLISDAVAWERVMKSMRGLLLGGLCVVAACVSETPRAPAPSTPPARAVPESPQPLPEPPPTEWSDIPLTAGNWSYRDAAGGSEAVFAASGPGETFVLRCDKSRRTVVLARSGITTGNTMTVRTSSDRRNYPLSVAAEQPPTQVFSAVAADDPFLDSIAFSRGRISVEVPGTPMLVMPAWSEPARVVEDCRG